MNAMRAIDPTRIFTRSEIKTVIGDLKRKNRSINTRQNLVIFRLSACCGLRVSEVVGLNLSNLKLSGARPYVEVPGRIAKRGKARRVPLWWDGATLADLQAWKAERIEQGGQAGSPVVCSQSEGTQGKPLSVFNAERRFKTAIGVLGAERVAVLSIHSGRHSFCSHSLAGGRSLAEVRDAAGHANVSTTSIYTHAVEDEAEGLGSIFEF